MKQKPLVLKTSRLLITPLSDAELVGKISAIDNAELKQAYCEMLDGCTSDPANRLWFTAWKICRKEEPDTVIGDLGFKGPQKNGAVELGYGIEDAWQGKGYATEAAKAMIDWAFSQKDVITVEAETAPENTKSQRVLEKLGFKFCREGEEGPRYELDAPAPMMMVVFMLLGMSVGMSFGLLFGSMPIGMCMGLSGGMAVGAILDSTERKRRSAIKAKR